MIPDDGSGTPRVSKRTFVLLRRYYTTARNICQAPPKQYKTGGLDNPERPYYGAFGARSKNPDKLTIYYINEKTARNKDRRIAVYHMLWLYRRDSDNMIPRLPNFRCATSRRVAYPPRGLSNVGIMPPSKLIHTPTRHRRHSQPIPHTRRAACPILQTQTKNKNAAPVPMCVFSTLFFEARRCPHSFSLAHRPRRAVLPRIPLF